ncbi:Nif3-like dinuclear metal center hexameric protein [Nostocaceae cyanobacterium CENA357]|uniref:GTP cyclohydrolase 1 type 2 homolog n=1 Tax=Atlanticothrix silvestris CENA357 TaxID=1725252 RepID=A0A8J7L497_9CYAN|nr:Nif3-like dinuclear metal center hexameric protein [Atlanticothrix silvestris]MBH8554576.1 Nif3-like dinuclear metal center hexameric protein [Atlanticothrix silvestris CENA357]
MNHKSNPIFIEEIVEFLNQFFDIKRFPRSERGGIYVPSVYPVKRLGLALEANTNLQEWIISQSLDALFIHRPWKLKAEFLPSEFGVISYHLPFDECLTMSFNPRLAQVLNIFDLEILGKKENRIIGMIGNIQTQSFEYLCNCITQIFGGQEQAYIVTHSDIKRVAVVGAITDLLVREAAERNADVYITGQFRKPAEAAIQETKMGVVAVGHHRSEAWGLRALAGVLRERWLNLDVVILPIYC